MSKNFTLIDVSTIRTNVICDRAKLAGIYESVNSDLIRARNEVYLFVTRQSDQLNPAGFFEDLHAFDLGVSSLA